MSEQLSLGNDQSCIGIRIDKSFGYQESVKLAEKIVLLAHQYKVTKFLIDVRSSSYQGSLSSQYFFVNKELTRINPKRRFTVAILASLEDNSYDFLPVVAHNNGYRLRVFKDQVQAIKWLQDY
uniref:STAS/SEC14 domain-containing protein n=2 Tax=Gloeothece TaxID=28070 RepID=E0UB80_GLOV7|nr:hypothetical protein Cyan7822_4411 [Gloeothece verrucosa PCC 7822]